MPYPPNVKSLNEFLFSSKVDSILLQPVVFLHNSHVSFNNDNDVGILQTRDNAKLSELQEFCNNSSLSNVKLPLLLLYVPPRYPDKDRSSRIQPFVHLLLLISPEGYVVNSVVLSSSDSSYNTSALEAVSQWVYSPPQSDALEPSYCCTEVTLYFTNLPPYWN